MTRDAWLDSPLARLAKIVGGFLLLIGLIFAAPDGIGLAILVLLALGAIVSLLIFPRRNATPSLEDAAPEAPHRGINISRITFAGFPGFVLVAGFVWMFWFGAPAYRPIVIVIALVGGLAGVALILLARRHRVAPSTPLGLSGHDPDRKE